MTSSKQRRRSAGRPEPSWRIRAIRRDPLDPRLLARLFIQMALERAYGQRTQTETSSGAPAANPDSPTPAVPPVGQARAVS